MLAYLSRMRPGIIMRLRTLGINGPGAENATLTKAANPVGVFSRSEVRGIPGAQSRFLERSGVPKKRPQRRAVGELGPTFPRMKRGGTAFIRSCTTKRSGQELFRSPSGRLISTFLWKITSR